ncbi:uncharacterized protein METZ01_LOCUS319261, partial [marine metagenome]
MGHHPVVGPHGLAVHVPRPVQHLDRLGEAEAVGVQGVPELGGLQDARCVRHDDPSGQEGTGGVRNYLPGFRKVEDNSVEVPNIDPLVSIPDLDVVVVQRPRSKHGGHVLLRPCGKVLPEFVAG